MSHITIAIITTEGSYEENSPVERLTLALNFDETWQFWEYKNNAINGQYDRDQFVNNITKNLGLSETDFILDQLSEEDYIDKNTPSRSAYFVTLTGDFKETIATINKSLQDKSIKYEWIDPDRYTVLQNSWLSRQTFIYDEITNGLSMKEIQTYKNEFLSTIERIQDAQKKDQLVILIGAGISSNSNIETWESVTNIIRENLDITEDINDQLVIPQLLYNEWGHARYYSFLENYFAPPNSKPNTLHYKILKLSPAHIITTNFDNLIETADTHLLSEYSIIRKDTDFPKAKLSKFIIKMHGDIHERNLVFKENDYLAYNNNFPLIESYLRGLFASKLVLILGFSFTDINLKLILERVRSVLKKNSLRPIIFLAQDKLNAHKTKYFESKGIDILLYEKSISKYIKSIKKIDKTINDQRGLKISNLLTFIEKYERFSERHRYSNIIEQMDKARLRFSQFRYVPPEYIAKVRPFALSENNRDHGKFVQTGFHFQTKNEEIIRLLKQFKNPVSNNINLNISDENRLKLNISQERLEKFKGVLDWLSSCSIRCIQLKDSISNSNHHQIKSNIQFCNCPTCRLKRFEILNSINSLAIDPNEFYTEQSEDWNLINYAYAQSWYGNYLESYALLKRAASNARLNLRYIPYFIALYNIKKLIPYINSLSVPNQIIKEQRDLIISEISEIDLDERLSSFKLPKIEKELLIDILHDKTLIRIEYKIDDLITSLEKVKLTYTREGEHWGSDYITNLLHSYAMLFSLLSGNYLFIILRGEYQILTHKVFYASLLAFTISDHYNAKLKQFDLFLFHQVIFYANPDKILNILADNGYPNLKLNKSQISQFINEVCNLLESTWDEDIFKNLLIPQPIKSQKELSFIFDQRLRYFVANSIMLLAVTEIYPKEEDIKRITSNVLNYLKVDLIAFEYKHFEILIVNKISWFSDDQLNILIEVLYKNYVRWERNIESIISSIISHKPSFKLSDPKILRSIQKSTLQNNDIRSLILLNPVLTIELSEQLKSQLVEYFKTKGITHENYVLYFEAIHFKALTILDGNLLDVYIASKGPIIQKVELSAIGDSYELNPGEANLFIDIIHQQKFDWPISLVNFFNSEETSPLMKWALKPSIFNYNNFNVNWLIAVKHNSLVKKTLKTMVISEMLNLVQAHLLTNYSYELWEIWKALSYKEHI